MKNKETYRGLLARKREDPAYRKRHEESYELLKLEVQMLRALERKHWSYADLARALRTQKSAVSRDLKGGGLRTASLARVARMAEVLGLRLFSFCVPADKAGRVLPVLRRMAAA